MPLMNAWVNPLKWIDAEPDFPAKTSPTPGTFIEYLISPSVDSGFEPVVRRYREISSAEDRLPVVPAEQQILAKLIWPLRQAKGSYALGDYLGCIASCGLAGEMAAMLLWDMSQPSIQGRPLDKGLERLLLGGAFEKLGQQRRVEALDAFGLLRDGVKVAFDDLRMIRRRYLHLLSQDHAGLPEDARKSFACAQIVVAETLGIDIGNGRATLRPDLMRYLQQHGVFDSADP
jgi:hypothetical protein